MTRPKSLSKESLPSETEACAWRMLLNHDLDARLMYYAVAATFM